MNNEQNFSEKLEKMNKNEQKHEFLIAFWQVKISKIRKNYKIQQIYEFLFCLAVENL